MQVVRKCYNEKSMTIRIRTLFFLSLGIIGVWLLFAAHAVLYPFVWGAIFSYIFNPLVNIFSIKLRFPRWLAVFIVFLFLLLTVAILGTLITRQLFQESSEIKDYLLHFFDNTKSQINTLPDWLRPTIYEMISSLQKYRLPNSLSLLPFFPRAISRIVSFLIFLVSGYYFLKDGNATFEKTIALIPSRYKIDVEILLRRINTVLGGYLRGQIFLVVLMSIVTFLALSILGVKFAVFLAVFSGFAEIVPLIGPIVAATLSVLVVLFTGNLHFGLTPMNGAIIVIILYFILRHAEDYFVIPHVMGRITKLPPFIIFLSVVIGGHLGGILGLIIAVPVAAIIKLLLEFSLDQLNEIKKS